MTRDRRELPGSIMPNMALLCEACRTGNPPTARFCKSCGVQLPAAGADGAGPETKRRTRRLAGDRAQVADQRHVLDGAMSALLIAGALTIVGGVIQHVLLDGQVAEVRRYSQVNESAVTQMMLVIYLNYALGLVYIGLGIWSRRIPLASSLIGLALFVTTVVVMAVINPLTLMSGIIFKVLIILALAKGVHAGLIQERKLRAQTLAPVDAGAEAAVTGAAQPGAAQPVAVKPSAAQPAAAQPVAVKPAVPAARVAAPGAGQPDLLAEAAAELLRDIDGKRYLDAVQVYRHLRSQHPAWRLPDQALDRLAKGLWNEQRGAEAAICARDLIAQNPGQASDAHVLACAHAVQTRKPTTARGHLAVLQQLTLSPRQQQQVASLEKQVADLERQNIMEVEFA